MVLSASTVLRVPDGGMYNLRMPLTGMGGEMVNMQIRMNGKFLPSRTYTCNKSRSYRKNRGDRRETKHDIHECRGIHDDVVEKRTKPINRSQRRERKGICRNFWSVNSSGEETRIGCSFNFLRSATLTHKSVAIAHIITDERRKPRLYSGSCGGKNQAAEWQEFVGNAFSEGSMNE